MYKHVPVPFLCHFKVTEGQTHAMRRRTELDWPSSRQQMDCQVMMKRHNSSSSSSTPSHTFISIYPVSPTPFPPLYIFVSYHRIQIIINHRLHYRINWYQNHRVQFSSLPARYWNHLVVIHIVVPDPANRDTINQTMNTHRLVYRMYFELATLHCTARDHLVCGNFLTFQPNFHSFSHW